MTGIAMRRHSTGTLYCADSRAFATTSRSSVLLPLYVRVEVLKGTLLYAPELVFIYDTATWTLREFDDFKHRLYDYTGQETIS
jgi:hypothetical protein